MRITVKASTETDVLFNLMNRAYDLLQLADATEGLGVSVQDVRDGIFVQYRPLSAMLRDIGCQLSESVHLQMPSSGEEKEDLTRS